MYSRSDIIKISDLDTKYQQTTSSLITFLIDCEMLHIDSLTVFNKFCQDNNVGIFLTYRQIDIKRRLKFKDVINIVTFPYETLPFLGYRNTVIYDQNNEIVAESYSLGNFVNIKTEKPIRLSEAVIDNIGKSPKHPMEYTNRRIILTPDYELVKSVEIIIQPLHIDIYQHVNNLDYVEFVLNHIDQDFEYNRVRTEYKLALKLEDKASLTIYTKKDHYLGVITNESGNVCCNIELIKL